ncbi:MAG: pyridoxamine kinase [Lachnospiraceae bacterium]|jgi:pyridoxine kinase|nr:pyridoxamine kinase [Lachnospiraceae bacterium]
MTETISHNRQKKIAVIQDISGFGRCSMTVAMPVISAMQIQCCIVPTSIFSNHTAFPNYFFDDYTDRMPEYIDNWKKLSLEFEGIYSGFLGSRRQVEIVSDFIDDFRTGRTQVIVDPVMGDHGRPYATCTPELCGGMKYLVKKADIVTPNLTEACILTDTPYRPFGWKKKEIEELAKKLHAMGPGRIVITGIRQGEYIANFVYDRGENLQFLRTHRVGTERCGTGDLFASIVVGDAVNQVPFARSVKKASQFVRRSILRSMELEIPATDGVCFEEYLYLLHDRRKEK